MASKGSLEVLGCIFGRFAVECCIDERSGCLEAWGSPGSQEQEIQEQGTDRELLQASIYVLCFPVTTSWS